MTPTRGQVSGHHFLEQRSACGDLHSLQRPLIDGKVT